LKENKIDSQQTSCKLHSSLNTTLVFLSWVAWWGSCPR